MIVGVNQKEPQPRPHGVHGNSNKNNGYMEENGKENGNYRDYRVYIGVVLGYIGVDCKAFACLAEHK